MGDKSVGKSAQKRRYAVVAGIFIRHGQVLMGRRASSENRFANFWEFPGGKIEAGETDEIALKREILEELGRDMLRAKHFLNLEWEYPDRVVDLRFYFMELDTHDLSKMTLAAHSELNWYPLEETKSLEALPANHHIIDSLLSVKDPWS